MESDSSHSLPNPSLSDTPTPSLPELEAPNETECTSRKRRRNCSKPPVCPTKKRPESIYWQYCVKGTRLLEDGRIENIGTCKECKLQIPANYSSTSGLKNHLENRCVGGPLYKGNVSDKSQGVLTNETMGQGGALTFHNFNQKRSEIKCAEYVIIDAVSFRAVEGLGLARWIHELQPRFKMPDRKKIAGTIFDLFLAEKAKIQSVICGQRVSITTDTWTSIQNINYMVVTAHFLDSDWKLHKRIINFTKIISHVGEEIGKMVEGCLLDWGLEKIFSIVVDNTSSNNTAIEYLKKQMESEKTLLFEGKYLQLRCACHIINLIVRDGLKELEASIASIRNVVVYIHSSPSRLNIFREFAVRVKFLSTSTVPMDVKTRWNSTYKMLDVALKYRRVFERMAEESVPFLSYFGEKDDKGRKRKGPPTADDWENAKAFVHFLKKFYDATLELSATKAPTSHLIYQSMIALNIEIVKKCQDNFDPTLQKVANAMKVKFDKYWGNWSNMNSLIFVANVLDPRNKLQMIKVSIRKLGGNYAEIQDFVDKVKKDLVTLWAEYRGMNRTTEIEKHVQMECDVRDGSSSRGGGLWDELYDEVEAQNEVENLQIISNEVDKYLADEIEKRSNQSFNLLEWWKGSETRYPVLSIVAKDIFAIPSSTVASESAFSLGKRVVDPFRTLLSPKMVEALVCTNDWLRADEFSFYKDPTDDDLDLYKEIEEIEKSAGVVQDTSSRT